MQSHVFAADSMSLVTLLPRLFISMIVVIAAMWVAARVMKNRQVPGSGVLRSSTQQKNAPDLQVVAKQGVGRNSSIAIVRAGHRELVIGITENNVALIADLNPQLVMDGPERPAMILESQRTGTPRTPALEVGSDSARKGLLEQVRELTVRKA